VEAGDKTIPCFVGTAKPDVSEQCVAMRVSQGGHDVPTQKIVERFPRIMQTLKAAFRDLPHVWIFDNSDLRTPYQLVALFESGRPTKLRRPVPKGLKPLLPNHPN
jgi:predicted ABC-type ATPase